MCIYVCALPVAWCPQRVEKGVGFSAAGVKTVVSLHLDTGNQSSKFLTAELCLHHPLWFLR